MSLLLAFQSAPVAADILFSLEAESFDEIIEDISDILSIQPPDGDPFIGLESFELEEELIEGFTGFFVEDDIIFGLEAEQDFDEFSPPDEPFAIFDFAEIVDILFSLESFDDFEDPLPDDFLILLPDDPTPPEPIEFLYSLSDEFEFEPETGIGIDIPDVIVDEPIATAVREWIIRARRRGRR